ncbi:hypothetical protein R9X47_17590 [Wukongibacter baidiensis]|uniref:hypothetical protein n=1 Tax=Wukongibacter baidiensis TaxID=1723361 RepID=UPI003D7F2570
MVIEINFILGVIISVIISVVVTNFFMKIANFIGDKLKIGEFFLNLLKIYPF